MEKDQEPDSEQNAMLPEREEISPKLRSILYAPPNPKHAYIVALMVLLCVGFSLQFWFSKKFGDFLWASGEAVFERHQYWRLFTALFTHADLGHLLSNLPLFIAFGWFLRTYFGFLAFPIAAFVVGALANLATLYFYPPTTRLIGASGVVYGLLGLWLTFYMRYEVAYSFRMRLFRVAGFSMIFLLPTTYSPTTSYLAHGFGFLFGILFALVLIATGTYDKQQQALQVPVDNEHNS